jgi:hypothetical protein
LGAGLCEGVLRLDLPAKGAARGLVACGNGLLHVAVDAKGSVVLRAVGGRPALRRCEIKTSRGLITVENLRLAPGKEQRVSASPASAKKTRSRG